MKIFLFLFTIAAFSQSPDIYAGKKRQHKAHEHGHGNLNIASEGSNLLVEIKIPAHDIVGFEHKAKTKKQRAAVEKAVKTLENPEKVLQFDTAAGCVSNKKPEVEAELGGEHDDHDDHDKDHKDDHDKGHKDGHDEDGEVHSEFHVQYSFNCKDMTKLKNIDVVMFQQFSRMKELKAQAALASGQFSQELTKKRSKLRLSK